MGLGEIILQLTENANLEIFSALALGFLTSISPCPLATNIAAVAYISRNMTERRHAVISAFLYTLGRMFSYSILGALIIVAGLEIPGTAVFLQGFGVKLLGPLLIVLGIIMLNLDRLPFSIKSGKLAIMGGRVARWGLTGSFLLGAIFALAFCPYSAVLYFGILIPLALKTTGGIALPAVYAVGTGFPVLLIGTVLSAGVAGVSSWFNVISRAERIIRVLVSLTFVGVGIYYVTLWVNS